MPSRVLPTRQSSNARTFLIHRKIKNRHLLIIALLASFTSACATEPVSIDEYGLESETTESDFTDEADETTERTERTFEDATDDTTHDTDDAYRPEDENSDSSSINTPLYDAEAQNPPSSDLEGPHENSSDIYFYNRDTKGHEDNSSADTSTKDSHCSPPTNIIHNEKTSTPKGKTGIIWSRQGGGGNSLFPITEPTPC